MSNKENLVPIGEVLKTYGVRGEVKVLLYNLDSNILQVDVEVWVDKNKSFLIEHIRIHNKFRLVKFKGYDRTNIENVFFERKTIYISREIFPKLKTGSFYLIDLISFSIIDNGNYMGRVIDVINLPTNSSLLIEYNDKEYLLPILDHLGMLFDFEGKQIIANNIDEYIF